MRVSVVGGSTVDDDTAATARAVGRLLGERGHLLICGGLGGVMAAACEGATAEGGTTVGILPGEDPADANPHVDVAVATGMGDGRNRLVALNGDAAIAIDGHHGTLTEIAHALNDGTPAAGIGCPDVDGVERVGSAEAAVAFVEESVGSG